jgi:hypothetical protein
MAEQQAFDLGDILSITTGCLVAARGICAVTEILNYMTGDDLFTHQLPRALRAAAPAIIEQHPQLADVQFLPPPLDWEIDAVRAYIERWLDQVKAQYGETLSLAPMAEWEYLNPLEELAAMTEKPIVVITTDGEEHNDE